MIETVYYQNKELMYISVFFLLRFFRTDIKLYYEFLSASRKPNIFFNFNSAVGIWFWEGSAFLSWKATKRKIRGPIS